MMSRRTGSSPRALSRAAGCLDAASQIRCQTESSSLQETSDKLQQHISPIPCIPHTGRRSKAKSLSIKKIPLQKPQVPPKPVHLKIIGQEGVLQFIPPAPSKPLPANPQNTKNYILKEKEQVKTSSGINALIEKFENIRQSIQTVDRSKLNLSLKMEPGLDTSEQASTPDSDSVLVPGAPTTEQTEADEKEPAFPSTSELSSPDVLKMRELNISDIKNCGDCTAANPSEETGNGDITVEENGNGKIPNRDSGIDSPSCSVSGEVFPNEETTEKKTNHFSGNPTEMETDKKVPGSSFVEEKRDSTQDEDSDMDEGSGEEPETDVPKSEDLDVNKCTEPQKLFHIANELLHTEEAYVKRLHLLDQVFCTKLSEAGIPHDVTTGIFSNISSIYLFHGQFLLPELKMRITQEWNSNPRIGDILQKLAPFLKMYGEYVKNFDRAMDMVNMWTQRSSQFKDVVQSIQKDDVCGNLTLQHHMLEPIQRIPRYELLLKDYLKKLPEDSPDRKDSEKSLELISTAANHSNAAIRKMEKMHKLLEVHERLGGEEDIVNPANELIKEGHIQKLSAKNGTAQDRYLFLFNSMVLYCVPKLRLIGQKFGVREKIDIAGLQVQEIAKPNATRTFLIIGKKRSLELQARTEEEKKEWIQVIQGTIEKHKQNSETFRAFNSSFTRDEEHAPDSPALSTSSVESMPGTDICSGPGGSDASKKSLRLKRDKEKQTCKNCNENFSSITKRRHHCKQCGAVICAKCSEFKPLADNRSHNRVCKECFLLPSSVPNSPGPEVSGEQKKKTTLEKQNLLAPEDSLFCSNLLYLDKGKTWQKVWVTVPRNEPLVLYLQGCNQDGRMPRAVPLPGYEVSLPSASEKFELKHVFKLSQSQQTIYFSAEDEELEMKWKEILTKAAKGITGDTNEGVENP
ncbi:FYVE, RhoGEF and PH domain-containing protein 3 [Microcaecilia unicolor]|uniref:FYVE, RhoGEF and PH domain-containing protein 3 n=1 Tax=Microcaecilia unicolor TaxID=1415580 RepID=A0A6P7YAP1_9AMPH|nr:FYVE, RhoGEF and PH domain-containing protein 3 [Microcaecilia unicolor]